jgi:hypothetical protein
VVRGALVAALSIAIQLACARTEPAPHSGPDSLIFRLDAAEGRPGRVGWLAIYGAEGRTARFRIELAPEPKGATLPAFVPCTLVREADSDASVLLRDLARALGTRPPPPRPGVGELELTAVVLGRDLSRGRGDDWIAGGFTSKPKGTWIATKLFFGDDAGEVFLNLDPIGGFGEFAMKDPAYGPAVVRDLGRLLQGPVVSARAAAEPPTTPAPTPVPTPSPEPAGVDLAPFLERAAPGRLQPERMKALGALAKMGPRASEAVPVFLKALEDSDPLIRGEALRGLPRLRPDPGVATAAVTPLLKDTYPVNAVWAAEALAELGDTRTAVTYLTVFLKGDARSWAAAALTRLGPAARKAVPALIEMLETRRNPEEGYAACRALAAIGRDAASALPALKAAERDADKHVRDAASFAVREIEGR